jgi:hypothetical protein
MDIALRCAPDVASGATALAIAIQRGDPAPDPEAGGMVIHAVVAPTFGISPADQA